MTYPVIDITQINHRSSQLIYDNGRKVVWVFPPKCAQTSLRKWVGSDRVISPVKIPNYVPNQYEVIMSVRDPRARVISAWRNRFREMPLLEVVKAAINTSTLMLDIHLKPQTYLLRNIGRELPDRFLRVGPTLEADCAALGFMPELVLHDNASGSKATDFLTLPDLIQDAFYDRYRDDFTLWERACDAARER